MPELEWRTTAGALINTISWTTVQRTSNTATLTFDLWNDYDNSGASTANNVLVYPVYQNASGTWLLTGIEPGDNQWLWMRVTGSTNPLSNTDPEYVDWSSGWYRVGGTAKFSVEAPLPRYMARRFECYLEPEGTGTITSIAAMALVVDYGRGTVTLPVHGWARHGAKSVFRGHEGAHSHIRATELQGARGRQETTATRTTMLIERQTYHLGDEGITYVPTTQVTGLTATDGSGNALTAILDTYYARVYKDPTGQGYTTVKGDRAASADATLPASPGSDYIEICRITKSYDAGDVVNGAFITNADIDNVALHESTQLRSDGTTNEATIGTGLQVIAGAHQDHQVDPITGITNGTRYAKISAQNVGSIDSTNPASTDAFLGTVTVAGGVTTGVQHRHIYDGRSSYRARRKELWSSWVDLTSTDESYFFGRLESVVSAGAVAAGTQTVTWVAGYRVYAHITTMNTEGDLRMSGQVINGAGTVTGAANEDFIINRNGVWVASTNRWMGAGGAVTPDVTLQRGAPGTLDVVLDAYRGRLWDNQNRPFQIARAILEFVPATDAAEFRFRLVKVPCEGSLVTVFDTNGGAALTTLNGSGAGIQDRTFQVEYHIDDTAAATVDTELRYSAPAGAFVDPWKGEGIYCYLSDVVDIKQARCCLIYYNLFE